MRDLVTTQHLQKHFEEIEKVKHTEYFRRK